LVEKDILDTERSDAIREKLVRSNAWGMATSADDLITAGRRSNWRLDDYIGGAFGDRAAWRAQPSGQVQSILRFLSAVEEIRPDLADAWIEVAVSTFHRLLPEVEPAMGTRIFLEFAWDIGDESGVSREVFLRIVDYVRSLPVDKRGNAPVLNALDELMGAFSEESEHLRFLVFMRLIGRLRPKDSLMAFFQFVQPGAPLGTPTSSKTARPKGKGSRRKRGKKR
ncbi:MAG TPA: hypothetical protein VJ204_11305, partial [Solirubrobacterales bacterium]|nr:hypothetical protein [Solirubrobacterales bacterium]